MTTAGAATAGFSPYAVEPIPVAAVPLTVERARAQPSSLLLSRYRIVPFTGRDDTMTEIGEWLKRDAPMSVRLLHAPAGHGKSRLAEHVATRYELRGWAVCRVRETAAAPHAGAEFPSAARMLVVIDYADRWTHSHLRMVMMQLYSAAVAAGRVVRVLLLARSAGFWWHALEEPLGADLGIDMGAWFLEPLARHPDSAPAPGGGLDSAAPFTDALAALSASGSGFDRKTMFTEAAAAFAKTLRVKHRTTPKPPAELADPAFESILAIHMAALVAVDARHRGVRTAMDPHALSGYLLDREYAGWESLHGRSEDPRRTPPETMRRTVYTATLTGVLTRADAREALARSQLATTTYHADHIIDDHRYCYPPEDDTTALQPLRPDRLGEDLIALTTPGHSYTSAVTPDLWAAAVPALLLTDPAPWAATTVIVLVETAHRWPHISTALQTLLREQPELGVAAGGPALTRLTELADLDPAILEAVDPLLSYSPNVDFDAAAAAISTRLFDRRMAATGDPAEHALIQLRHTIRLAIAGRYRDAQAVAEPCVATLRGLRAVGQIPEWGEAGLALALVNLGACLASTGQRQQALEYTQEAVDIQRRLAAADPLGIEPDLALTLTNLGAWLAEAGRHEESAVALDEAMIIRRRLAAADPDAHEPGLAVSLANRGSLWSRIGHHRKALGATRESVAIRQRLAEADPAAHAPELARALTLFGVQLREVGQHEQSVRTTTEAVAMWRRFALGNSVAYEPELAAALNNLGVMLREVGRLDDALSTTAEAFEIGRRLAATDPLRHSPTLAASATNFAAWLSTSGRDDLALAPAAEAVAIQRRLAAENPVVHEPELVAALNHYGSALSGLGRTESALRVLRESVVIQSDWAAHDPVVHEPALAVTLNNFAALLTAVGRVEEALAVAQEAVGIFRRLFAALPEAHAAGLAKSLRNLGLAQALAGRRTEALAAAKEAVERYRFLARRSPAAFDAELTTAYTVFAYAQNLPRRRIRSAAMRLAQSATAGTRALLSGRGQEG
ncbi:tetratricopeptide repeat protein [Nocardia sp. alder85J]|uniref:tetratricopeptide repeat protein n=1 Tax=Nocardia sp. alder85J TaxID=2862949 RepID=UPI001CD79455|nr:tetratricopeptide repeat protein [Nocardia sp. alder85J]MCX4094622.1 tetratricopeptide repeat protein [Nocardia sp. alder85J]